MFEAIERILDALEDRRLTRREAVVRIGAVAAILAGARAPAGGQEPASSTFKATGLNHIALRVTDVPRSRDFYRKHLGMNVLSESEGSCFMSCGPDHFVALFGGEEGSMDHYCYTIEDYDPARAVTTLDEAGLSPRRTANRVYFDDPDGLTVQVSGSRTSRPG